MLPEDLLEGSRTLTHTAAEEAVGMAKTRLENLEPQGITPRMLGMMSQQLAQSNACMHMRSCTPTLWHQGLRGRREHRAGLISGGQRFLFCSDVTSNLW